MLKETFFNLISNYTKDKNLISELWDEIVLNYSNKKRHYHTLSHLENLLKELLEVNDKINEWQTILFTLFYHDIVYNALKSNNEEKSADLAKLRMETIKVPSSIIKNCELQILATKKHLLNSGSDTNYFLDADLSILGKDLKTYTDYSQNVRKEYSYYPALIYNPGRKKVLKHFLEMNKIFKTDHFSKKYEIQAKANLSFEFNTL